MDKKYRKTALAEPSGFDHRVIKDRREDYSLNYFKKNGEERRSPIENRQGWPRFGKWPSIFTGDYVVCSSVTGSNSVTLV